MGSSRATSAPEQSATMASAKSSATMPQNCAYFVESSPELQAPRAPQLLGGSERPPSFCSKRIPLGPLASFYKRIPWGSRPQAPYGDDRLLVEMTEPHLPTPQSSEGSGLSRAFGPCLDVGVGKMWLVLCLLNRRLTWDMRRMHLDLWSLRRKSSGVSNCGTYL